MKIVIPTFIFDNSNKLDQLKLLLSLIHSYYYYNNDLDIIVFTNSDFIKDKVLEFGKSYDSKISVDYKNINDIQSEMSEAYEFFQRVNNSKTTYNININLIYHYCFLNYSDVVVLDNDMLFLKQVDFKNIINNKKVNIFHNYVNIGGWTVNDFFKNEYKENVEFHGGTWYIPNNINIQQLFKDYINSIENNFDDISNIYVTDEPFMFYLYKYGLLENIKGNINSYNLIENDNVSLLHYYNKPTKISINKQKEIQFKTKPIDTYNQKTFKQLNMTPNIMYGYLHWFKHLCYVNETLNSYFRDLKHVGSEFFEEILKAVKNS